MTVTTFEGIENAGSPPEDGAEDCEHEYYAWTSSERAECVACSLEITGTRHDPRYVALHVWPRIIKPNMRLVAWLGDGEIWMGAWTGPVHQDGIVAFASSVLDEIDTTDMDPGRLVIRLVGDGGPGPVVYRDGGVRGPERG